ncbi:MAG: efflux RND transporter periplasmic adaptor subunit [Chloroflexota bacterium]
MDKELQRPGKGLMLYVAAGIIIIVAVVVSGILVEKRKDYLKRETRERAAAASAGQGVRVVSATRSRGIRTVTLAGEARPYAAVTLYAKVSGYLKEIRVDKGDRVKTGQLLAVIESPELDRQYEAALVDAQNKRKDFIRAKDLVEKGYISRQEADHAEADAKMAEANAEALRAQKDYEILRAPFDSTVTARFADPGALVQSAITSQTTTLPVVALSQTNRLRVYVYLSQQDASIVRLGDRVEVYDSARPEVRLPASISRVSGELGPKTRTLLAEIDIDNREGRIVAGSSVQVSLMLKTAPLVEIPAEALLSKGETGSIATVSGDNKASFRKVVVADSDGKMVRLPSGLSEGELVILNPGFGISVGMHVEPVRIAPK